MFTRSPLAIPPVHSINRHRTHIAFIQPKIKSLSGLYRVVHCFAKYVKVAFFQGASLRPLPPGESKQKDVRYLDIHEDDELDDAQLAAWVKQASHLPGKKL